MSSTRLRVTTPAGRLLAARVEALSGDLLASGQGEILVPGAAGQPVRVSAAGHVARVILLPPGSAEITLTRGRVLRGEVVAAEDGSPLPLARIEAQEGLVRSDSEGRFELVVPDQERIQVLVTAKERPATRATEAVGILRVEVPRGLGARGRVVRSDRRPPGPTRLLVVGGQQLHRSFPATSDAEGNFELEGGLSPGEQVMIFAWNEAGWQSARAPRWQSIKGGLEVVLEEPAALLLRQPGVLTPVHVWPGEAPSQGTAHRHHPGLAPGAYRLEVPGEDPLVLELRAGEELRPQIRPLAAPRDSKLRVRVVDEFGAPLSGVEVDAQVEERLLSARTDAAGLAELALPSAALQAPLTVSGRAPGRVPLPVVAPVGAREVELVLALRTTLEILVSPAQALEVTVYRGQSSLVRATTGSDGRLRLEDLPAGPARLVIESARGEEIERSVTLPLNAPLQIQVER